MDTRSLGSLPNLSNDAVLLIQLQEKERIIANLTHRIRTMSSVNLPVRSETKSKSYSQSQHTKSKSLQSADTNTFSIMKWFRGKRASDSTKHECKDSSVVRRNSRFIVSAGSICFDDLNDFGSELKTKYEQSKPRYRLEEMLENSIELEQVEKLLSSEECLQLTGFLHQELDVMCDLQIKEVKRRSLLLPHQLASLRARF